MALTSEDNEFITETLNILIVAINRKIDRNNKERGVDYLSKVEAYKDCVELIYKILPKNIEPPITKPTNKI